MRSQSVVSLAVAGVLLNHVGDGLTWVATRGGFSQTSPRDLVVQASSRGVFSSSSQSSSVSHRGAESSTGARLLALATFAALGWQTAASLAWRRRRAPLGRRGVSVGGFGSSSDERVVGRTLTRSFPVSHDQEDEEEDGAMGILQSIADLPKTEALGIELRATAALAAPVCAKDGSFIGTPFRIRHTLGKDPKANLAVITDTILQLIEHFSWKGVTGCSVTKEVLESLDINHDNFQSTENEVGEIINAGLKGKVSFFHAAIHTHPAGLNELVWGGLRNRSQWSEKVVLVCTLGKHLGAVLFNDGRRVRNSPLNDFFTSLKDLSVDLPLSSDGKFTPPEPGTPGFEIWADLVDRLTAEIVESVTTLDSFVILPTGRSAIYGKQLPSALPPLLHRTRDALAKKGAPPMLVLEQDEGSVVRGMSLSALVELEGVQMAKSLESVVNGSGALHSLSEAQLSMIFDRMDGNCDKQLSLPELRSGLGLLGIQRDAESLHTELDKTQDGMVSFPEFSQWWLNEVIRTPVVIITSKTAWCRLVEKKEPAGYSDLMVLEVSFTFCRSCRAFEPKFKKFAQTYNKVRFVQLVGNASVGAMTLCTKKLNVKVSPAFFVFRRGPKGGTLLHQWTGANAERFEENLEKCLKQEQPA
ncbi:unnamed protein product [Polarella glacialis]|uniref:EF-hand domain-containing protein n=1 Tax=Polarella glacialis TaxID=89957 RepID=A0A813D4F4_POLGL|nr:unnamed protein product [Polarella glacialis]